MLIQINTNIVNSECGIGFDSRSAFSFTDGSTGKNVTIFGADMCSSVHIDKKNENILVFGEGPTQGLDDTPLTAKAKYPINFSQSVKDLYTIMEATVSYLLMIQKYINLTQKTLK